MENPYYPEDTLISIIYCDECINKLERYGEMILSFYENVCEKNLINKAIVGLRIDTDPMTKRTLQIIKFLEFRRFVVSTEIGQKQIGVKVRGVHRFNGDEGNLFYICANREEHKKAPTNRG